MIMPYLNGLATGAALIIAIGAQNAFVLSNGIKKNHILVIVLICSFCDALLIIAGVSGVGAAISANPLLTEITLWGGALFLFWYAFRSLRSAFNSQKLEQTEPTCRSFTAVMGATFAVTLLNPHVYLDTMILVGSIGSRFGENERLLFTLGAISASFIWFFTLGFGGSKLAPFFQNALSWKILDVMVGLIMLTLGTSLILQGQGV